VASDVVGCGDEALYPPLIKTLVQVSAHTLVEIVFIKKNAIHIEVVWAVIESEGGKVHGGGEKDLKETK
jgi:hypothetical protein